MKQTDIRAAFDLTLLTQAIQKACFQTLVIFDVDDVVMEPRDQILQSPYRNSLEPLYQDLEKRFPEEEVKKLGSIIYLSRQNKLVDLKLLPLFKLIEEKKAPFIFLTNSWVGPFGKIPSLEDWRITELKRLGIPLSQAFLATQAFTFKALPSQDPQRFPLFKEGILFTCEVEKGKVLGAFLNQISFQPHQIIFIDDKEKYLRSVATFCHQAKIAFKGFHYKAVESRPFLPLDKERAVLQFKLLETNHIWMSDKALESS